jgi:hypothetical protein
MTKRFMTNATLAFAGVLLAAETAHADKPAWCTNGSLMETRSFSDGGEARDYANAQSGSSTINGVTHIVIGTINVVKVPVGNLVYVVHVWDCPKDPPANGGGQNGGRNGGNPGTDKDKEKVTPTLDPHPELDRNGKRRQ